MIITNFIRQLNGCMRQMICYFQCVDTPVVTLPIPTETEEVYSVT